MLVSALPPDKFLKAYEGRLKAGLANKFQVGMAYDSLFRQFYGEEMFDAVYEKVHSLSPQFAATPVVTEPGLAGPSGLHPEYDADRAMQDIRNRYSKTLEFTRYTIRRLIIKAPFQKTVASLRGKGWKDWHILTAILNVRLNYLANRRIAQAPSRGAFSAAMQELMSHPEMESDRKVPEEMFSETELEKALPRSQITYLRQLGFDCGQRTPNFASVDKFLRRFRYWEDDIPHEDPFPGDEQVTVKTPG